MNELSDYRRTIGSFLPNRGPRRRRKWQPYCKQKMSTTELLRVALVGVLWITAVYISVDVNLKLLRKVPPVPVSDFFARCNTLPCRIVRGMESMELWGKGGLSGLFDVYMGVENWQNRVSWALISYATHQLFVSLKLRRSGDIELNPGPISGQSDTEQRKASRGRGRRTTRAKTREEAGTPQSRRWVQSGTTGGYAGRGSCKYQYLYLCVETIIDPCNSKSGRQIHDPYLKRTGRGW